MFSVMFFLAIIVFVVASFIICMCIEEGHPISAFAVLALVVFIAELFFVPVLSWAYKNPSDTLLIILGYFAAGVVWSGIKWFSFTYKVRDIYFAAKAAWNKDRKNNIWSTAESFAEHKVNRAIKGSSFEVPLKVTEHKARITLWMAYWPWSALWTLFDDPIRRIYNWLYNSVAGFYQSISDRAFKVD